MCSPANVTKKPFSGTASVLRMACLAILFAGLLQFVPVHPAAASEEPSSWSLDFKGGVTIAHFTFESRPTGHGVFQLRYSMNPLVSLYGSAGVGAFRASETVMDQAGYSNDYFLGGLGARVNVLQMFSSSSGLTNWLGLYTTTGVQLMRNDVRISNRELPGYVGTNFTGNALILNVGAGASLRLNRRIDLFLQTELNHSDSDMLDGYERLPGASRIGFISGGDSFVNTSAGITIKLGGSDARHMDWQERQHIQRSTAPPSASYDQELALLQQQLERSDRIKEELARRMQSLAANMTEFSELINTTQQQQLDSQDLKLEQLQDRLDQLQSQIETLAVRRAPEVADPAEAAAPSPADADQARYFVVAGAFRNRDNAGRLLEQIRAEGHNRASIVTDPQRGFYIVAYAGYPVREQAEQAMAQVRARINPEAWIFTR